MWDTNSRCKWYMLCVTVVVIFPVIGASVLGNSSHYSVILFAWCGTAECYELQHYFSRVTQSVAAFCCYSEHRSRGKSVTNFPLVSKTSNFFNCWLLGSVRLPEAHIYIKLHSWPWHHDARYYSMFDSIVCIRGIVGKVHSKAEHMFSKYVPRYF
jgi:hypothetical protein